MATSCYESLNNYMMFNDVDGIYTHTFEAERKTDCLGCSNVPRPVRVDDPNTMTLENLIEFLCENAEFQMKNPGKTILSLWLCKRSMVIIVLKVFSIMICSGCR